MKKRNVQQVEGQINLIVVSLSGLSNAATKMAKSCAQLRHGSGLHHLRVYKWFGCVPQPVFRWYMCVLVKFSVYFFLFHDSSCYVFRVVFCLCFKTWTL